MEIETLGDAFTHSVKIRMYCAEGPHTGGMKRGRECHFSYTLDMMTMLATRGRKFPVTMLNSRLKCPSCGSSPVRVFLDVPSQPKPEAARGVAPDVVKAEELQKRILGRRP